MVGRNIIPLVAGVFLLSCSIVAPVSEDASNQELHDIADDYLGAILRQSPFAAVFSGINSEIPVDNAAFNNNGPAAAAAFEAAEDVLLKRIEAVDASRLNTRADWVLYETLREGVTASVQSRICRRSWWNINHMFGWQNSFARIADAQSVATPAARADALKRWAQLPAYIAQEQANMEIGLANGYSAPKRVTARVIAQLDRLAVMAPENLPFIAFAQNVDDAAFRAHAQRLAAEKIQPAIAAYRDYLRDEYLPHAREALTIMALPEGLACYEALLRGYHTIEIGAEETYRRGKEAVARNKEGVVARGKTMFGENDFETILSLVKDNPENRFESEAALIAETRALIPVTKEKIKPFFSSLPTQDVIVEPYPDYLKGTGQSSRYEQKPPAIGPAIYRINTDDWRSDTRGGAEIVAVHEGWPGHHLQIASSHGLQGLHPVTRLLRSTAYVEGWARYAEALAEEAGVYESGYGEITRRAWPARGMVVDPGMHVFGWSNEEAKAFLKESGRFDDEAALDARLDRIAVIPGQLTAYDTGGLEIFALRREAENRLGDRFDIGAFHDRILENGALPLGALRDHVSAWIAAEEKR